MGGSLTPDQLPERFTRLGEAEVTTLSTLRTGHALAPSAQVHISRPTLSRAVAAARPVVSVLVLAEPRHLEEELIAFMGSPRVPWFTNLVQALQGVDHRYAARDPGHGLNSIWAVVNHVSFWHDLALRRLRGEFSTDAEALESGWSLPAGGGAGSWARTQQELIARNVALARAVGTLSPDQLEEPWADGRAPRWHLAYGLMNHTSHHTADVLIARRLLGIPLPDRR